MKDVIRHNRRFQLGTVAALVNPREIYTESRNSACRTGVSRNVHFILVKIVYWVPFGSARCLPVLVAHALGGYLDLDRSRRVSHVGVGCLLEFT